MKFLVFGKNGQLGHELSKLEGVQCLSRSEADLMYPERCAEQILSSSADAIINAAAYTAVDKAEEESELADLINGTAPACMAAAAARAGKPFVQISTDYVFRGNGQQPWKPDDTPEPQNAYGRSKLIGEEGVKQAGGVFAILRTSWVYSSRGTNFVKTMLKLGQTRKEVKVVGDQIGGPTSARDLAKAAWILAGGLPDAPDKAGIYHYSGAPDSSWAEFATEIFSQTRQDIRVVAIPTSAYPTPAQRPPNSRLDCEKIKSHFGVARPRWRASLKAVLSELKINT